VNAKTQRDEQTAKEKEERYEPPRVELALTSEQLEREVQYAGTTASLPF